MAGSRAIVVGAFVIFGILLFGAGLFFIGDRRMMFSKTFEVYAEFANIAALQGGAIVRVGGMDAGEVETINVPQRPSAPFRVKMRVREDLHQLIRIDSVASIQSDGLVGNKFVQVEVGTEQSQPVPAKGTIKSEEPFDLPDMLKKMSGTIDLVTTTIVDVQAGLNEALQSVSTTAIGAQELMNGISADVRKITASTQMVTEDLTVIVSGVRQGRGTVGKLLADDSLYTSVQAMSAEAGKAVANLREASEQAKGAIADFRGENGPMKGVTGDLQQTLKSAKDAMADLAENTEALKRGFFFRGFFNDRGYFDLDDVSVQQYREGALETRDRRVLRIWVGAAVLFAKDGGGNEILTDDGRARLDSAMAQFVQYPRTSPLVVEGYRQDDTGDARFLQSRARAQLVRDYVVGKFGLNPQVVAIMPMGSQAIDSPTGSKWDGIALAIFVPRAGK